MPATTVNVTPAITLIYGNQGSNGSPILLVNLSSTVTVYIGFDQTIQAAQGPVIPINPGASYAFDGSISIYGVVAAGQQASIGILPGGVSYSPGASIDALYTLASSFTFTSSTFTVINLLDVSAYNSYDLATAVLCPVQSTAGMPLACQVHLSWYDDLVSGVPIAQEIWYPWVVTTANPAQPQGICASGPMHGHYMTITITIPAAGETQTIVPYFNLFGSPRNLQQSDWRQCWANHVTDNQRHIIPLASGYGYDNSLADSGTLVTLSANTNYWMPLNLYSGPAMWAVQTVTGIVITGINIIDLGSNFLSDTSGNIDSSQGGLAHPPVTAPEVVNGSLLLPRSACALLVNVGNTGGQFLFKCVAQQGA